MLCASAGLAHADLNAFQSALLSYHPVSYWPLNETSGTVAHDLMGQNNGTYTGGYTLGQAGVAIDGGSAGTNLSAAFDGSSGYVNIPYKANLNITSKLSVVAWVKVPSTGEFGFGTVIGHSDASYRMTVDVDYPRFVDSSPDVIGTVNIADGNWHLLVGVYDGSEHLYVDGQQTGPSSQSVTSSSTYPVMIAASPDYVDQRNFVGNIAHVAVLTNALTAAQIGALYYTLGVPATVTVTPVDPTIYTSASIKFTALTNGTPPLSVQWYYIDSNNTSNAIAGATNNTYTIASATLAENGYQYGALVKNPFGTNTAETTLTVENGPPYIVPGGDLPILNAEAYAGAPVTYSIGVAGSEPIYFQWLVDGVSVAGATNSSFTYGAGCGSHTIQVAVTNAENVGSPVLSSVATILGDPYPESVTFTNGAGWQLNGSVQNLSGTVLELTDDGGGEASSAFYNTPQFVGAFTASYVYQGIGGADGVTFCLQADPSGADALGGTGGDLGFYGITNSYGLELNIYIGSPIGIATGTNGATLSGGGGAGYAPTGSVSVASEDPILFQLTCANGNLLVVMTDQDSGDTYTTNYPIGSITNVLGGSDLAYVGFTGADGGVSSQQTISDFVFTPTLSGSESLAVTHTPGFVKLIWSSMDSTYSLQQSADLLNWIAGPAPTSANGTNTVTVATSGMADQVLSPGASTLSDGLS